MILVRMIAPKWLMDEQPTTRRVIEGMFSSEQILEMNIKGYNAYYLPNGPKHYVPGKTVDGTVIDDFKWVFVDMDLKDGKHKSKEAFISLLSSQELLPTKIVDSGNGIHAYWKVSDLDAFSYLRLCRRLIRRFDTDEAVGQLFQLMRLPESMNTKVKDNFKICETIHDSGIVYTSEKLDSLLPPITLEDEAYCKQHYEQTHKLEKDVNIDDKLPPKFGALLESSDEAKALFTGNTDDRSKADFRLGHLLLTHGFTKEEAVSVLLNSSKAMERAPVHRFSYAMNIVDKIGLFKSETDLSELTWSSSVEDILNRPVDTKKGVRFACDKMIDNTHRGFRLGQVIGLVAGSGVGKTTFALNMFRWCSQKNPDYHHFFIPLEQPAEEIAERWQTLCGSDKSMHSKVHILSNYDEEGNFRHLSLGEIRSYIEKFEKIRKIKVGCVVIDHIGALKKKGKEGENQDLMAICHEMKAFAVQSNTMVIMQSQTSRAKAGIGDLELDKDAAYGTMYFEAYCDFLITIWQPLKRCHAMDRCPTVTAYKFCKIRHKKPRQDVIQEDVPYYFYFDSEKESLRRMTQLEMESFQYFIKVATKKRSADKSTDTVEYQNAPFGNEGGMDGGKVVSAGDGTRH